VGGGVDEVAYSGSAKLIGSSTGSFSYASVSGEADNKAGTDYYSLQVNSETFATNTPYTGNKAATAMEQFLFLNDPGNSTGYILIQYWLNGYQGQYGSCPSTGPPGGGNWTVYSGNCYANSLAGAVASEPSTNLINMVMKGYANYNSADQAVFCSFYNGEEFCVAVAGTEQVLNLYKHWHHSEFNVFGYGYGSQANFNKGTSLTVVNSLQDQASNTIVPSCASAGYTTETNNLNLGSCSASSNGIIFPEFNGPVAQAYMTLSYVVIGGGTPSAPIFYYYAKGGAKTLTLTKKPKIVSVDAGTTWWVSPNPLSGSSSSQQWIADASTVTGIASNETVTFTFQHQYYLTMHAKGLGSVVPVSGWQNSGLTVTITAIPNSGHKFNSWTGTGLGCYKGTSNPATVTMNAAITETATFT
jgi:hypothetical protein